MLPPTSQLPLLKSIKSTSIDELQSNIDYLWLIYNPPVRGTLRRNHNQRPSSSSHLPPKDPDPSQFHRTDPFERDYAIKWLTALISLSSQSMESHSPYESLIQNAASLLATCAGTASAGIVDRTFIFDTSTRPITVKLKDVPLDNHDYRSVGAQTWGSACIMADMIAQHPSSFGLPEPSPTTLSFRCLELGAGTGLVSLTIAKILDLSHLSSNPDIEIVTTDCYPTVLKNLERNISTNIMKSSAIHITTQPLDWSAFFESKVVPSVFQNQTFDMVYGADIVYEARHAEWIKACLIKLLRKPANPGNDPTFHLIIPLRKTHTVESDTIEQVFEKRQGVGDLIIKYKEIIICESETGSSEEVEYVYYKIGWEI